MLSKAICKRCRRDSRHPWDEADEKLWGLGRVWCPLSVRELNLLTVTRSAPPERCPYAAEQLVSDATIESSLQTV